MRCGVRTVGIQHKTRARAQVFSAVDAVGRCLGTSWSLGCLMGVLYALQWVAKVGKGQRNWRQAVSLGERTTYFSGPKQSRSGSVVYRPIGTGK